MEKRVVNRLQVRSKQDGRYSSSTAVASFSMLPVKASARSRKQEIRMVELEPVIFMQVDQLLMTIIAKTNSKQKLMSKKFKNLHKDVKSKETKPDEQKKAAVKKKSKLDVDYVQILWSKPPLSCICLVGLAIANSAQGELPLRDIYPFFVEALELWELALLYFQLLFPIYFRRTDEDWRRDVRSRLRTEYFARATRESDSGLGCAYWIINPNKRRKFQGELATGVCKGRALIRTAMFDPENLELILNRGLHQVNRLGQNRVKQENSNESSDSANEFSS